MVGEGFVLSFSLEVETPSSSFDLGTLAKW